MEVVAKKISKISLFKLILSGIGSSICVFCILCGFAALFGMSMVQVNGVYRYGFEGMIYGVLIGPVLAVVCSAGIWCFMAFGLWIMSFFKPLTLTFKDTKDVSDNGA